jgi:hypothetical protein
MEVQPVSASQNHRCDITIGANHFWHHPALHVYISQSFWHALELVLNTFQPSTLNNMVVFPQEQVNENSVSCVLHNPPGIRHGNSISLTTRHATPIDNNIIPHPLLKSLCQNKKTWMQSMIMGKNI